MTWEEDEVTSRRRMQFAEECIETKTVTTTTTTKRSYPSLFVREPRSLQSLDSKEYPLAARQTPPELRKLTFDVDDHDIEGWAEEDSINTQVRGITPLATRFRNANKLVCRCDVHKVLTMPTSSNLNLAWRVSWTSPLFALRM